MRCYFHLEGPRGDGIPDELGTDVATADQARFEAMKAIAELRGEDPGLQHEWDGWRLVIVDGEGRRLSAFDLNATASLMRRAHPVGCSGDDNVAPV